MRIRWFKKKMLVARLKGYLDGLPPETRRRIVLEMFAASLPSSDAPEQSSCDPRIESLTPREKEILVLMSQGMSNAEIAAHLVVSATTVKTHVGNVLAKLDVRDRVQAVVWAFRNGLAVLTRLAPVFLCRGPGSALPGEDVKGVTTETFEGPHPAGLAGTHIHFLYPVDATRTVWTINYQDVIAIGHLFTTGELDTGRVIALGGPVVKKPRLLRTRLGASLDELVANELEPGENRVVSGSLLGGRTARGACAFLGRYDLQVSCLREGTERQMLHFLRPGFDKHSVSGAFVWKLFGRKPLAMTTTTNGSPRAMVPTGTYEAVMPLDILPTQLLRSLIVGDTEMAQKLGCLELDEEDLALCTYACAGKYEYGPILRDNLTRIEKEG